MEAGDIGIDGRSYPTRIRRSRQRSGGGKIMATSASARLTLFGVVGTSIAISAIAIAGARSTQHVAAAQVAPVLPIIVSVVVPAELPSKSQRTPPDPHTVTLRQAAEFAWEEFIALNWAAVPQHGVVGSRGIANSNCIFGDLTSRQCAGPTVWETFRGKVEIFPGAGNPPGYPAATPAPASSGDPYLGWDALPRYNYQNGVSQCMPAGPAGSTAWVNLDETDQITLDQMYAGSAPTARPSTAPYNTEPQLIRFLAKANRTMYTYIAANKWWGLAANSTGSAPPLTATSAYVSLNLADPPNGSSTMVSFPAGTLEVKSAWRLLNGAEAASSRYRTTTVRYYDTQNGQICWNQDTFGMVALHIIQKTPATPYFVYATFEQADNIRNAAGKSTEDDDGRLIAGQQQACAVGQPSPCPTTPTEGFHDAPNSMGGPKIYVAPSAPPTPTPGYCSNIGARVYYLEEKPFLPHGGYFCVNARDNPIPKEIVAVNALAHAAIRAHDVPGDPFRHYKLVNVQYFPIDLAMPSPGIYTGHNPRSAENPASFYMSNGVVETDRGLQLFSGGLLKLPGTISNYYQNFPPPNPSPSPQPSPPWLTHKNTAYAHHGFDMGGCMGCHGSQGQSQGGDFSVITAEGSVLFPEPPHPNPLQPAALANALRRNVYNRRLVNY
jgi:hypothetical protein